jgi:putative transposase
VVIEHIRDNCRAKDIFLDAIGGWSDHLHLLISLGRQQDIAKVTMLIKGESAHWLNQQGLIRGKFRWQDDYYAISVSESQVSQVRAYIARQEDHHKAVPFDKELERLREVLGLKPE